MKKLLFSFLFFFFFWGVKVASAQSFNSGLIAGATFSQVDGDNYAGYHQLGFTAGAYVNLPLDDYFSAQMELKYSLLGAHSSDKCCATIWVFSESEAGLWISLPWKRVPALISA